MEDVCRLVIGCAQQRLSDKALLVGFSPHIKVAVTCEGPATVTQSPITLLGSLWPEQCEPSP